MLVTQVQDEALITVVNTDSGQSVDKDDAGANGSVSVGRNENALVLSDTSDLPKPLQITLEIGPETMTGRLRQTIRGTRKYETSKYGNQCKTVYRRE